MSFLCNVKPVEIPPNVPVDSEDYQAYLKSRLDLACAAVALTRVAFTSLYLSLSLSCVFMCARWLNYKLFRFSLGNLYC